MAKNKEKNMRDRSPSTMGVVRKEMLHPSEERVKRLLKKKAEKKKNKLRK